MRIILTVFFIGMLFSSSYGFAQEHHHGHEANNIETQSMIEIMQGMNANLNTLTSAILAEDFPLITSSAHDIANHPGIEQEDLHKLFERLGSKKEEFIACDSAVHHLAKEISEAGAQKNMGLILEKYYAMIGKTVECHQKYRGE